MSLAYPVTDLVLLTLIVVLVTHARHAAGSGLGQLAAGLVLLCTADSGFAYLTAHNSYATGSLVDAGRFAGFLLIAAAAHCAAPLAAASTPAAGTAAADLATPDSATSDPDPDPAADVESTARALLPYLPAAVGLTVALAGVLTGRGQKLALAAATVVMAALLGRQLLAVLDNRRLVTQLFATQAQLRHQAFHDPLTGLANGALFTDRLRHGLDLHRRDLRPLSLLYCDLDGFKTVNDTLGHDVGDDVLKAVAERLLAITRPGDPVARLGGDEFAILLEDGGEAAAVFARVIAAFAQPACTGRHNVPLGGSIGIAELAPDAAPLPPAELLRRADAAMYHAKHTGTGLTVTWTEHLTTQHQTTRRATDQPQPALGRSQLPTAAR